MSDTTYAGFWLRVAATIIDSILLTILTTCLTLLVVSPEALLDGTAGSSAATIIINLLPVIVTILFWYYRSATPGKMMLDMKIVDLETGEKPSTGKFVIRYFSYLISMIPFMLGFIWVAFDKNKQGWHDKIAGTAVVMQPKKYSTNKE